MDIPPTVSVLADDPHGQHPTPPLEDFLSVYNSDDNWWWRTDCGHHQNLFEEAVDRIADALERHGPAPDQKDLCITCRVILPCPTMEALQGVR